MTSYAAESRRFEAPRPGSRAMSPVFALAAVALIVLSRSVRTAEAALQSALLSPVMDSKHVGTAVIFPVDGHLVGVSFSIGCSVGPVLALFLIASAVVTWVRPLPARSVALGVLALLTVFVVANQLRIGVIVASMHLWGFQRGYDLSHVFLGSTITTLGFVLAVILFVKLLVKPRDGVR
jgi:exosortase/archaeosortase family protein